MRGGRFRVAWTEQATNDLVSIVAYIAAESPKSAQRVLQRLRSRATTLRQTPQRGRIVPELLESGIRIWRELLEPPYRLIYTVREKNVHVFAVFDGRRNLRDILLERLTRPPGRM